MGRKFTSVKVIDQASSRFEGLAAISETLDLGNGITLATFKASIENVRAKESSYQQQLSILEEKQTAFEVARKQLADMSSRVLSSVAAKYGRDSVEYTRAGGVRSSDRRRPSKKAKSANSVISGQ